MEKYQKLFIYIFSLIIIYFLFTRIPVLPDHVVAISTKKIIKGAIGLAMGAGALWIYLKREPSSKGKATRLKDRKRWM